MLPLPFGETAGVRGEAPEIWPLTPGPSPRRGEGEKIRRIT